MNQEQQDRFNELEEQAVENCLQTHYFDVVEYLDDDEEKKEYCVLRRLEIDDTCVCGFHQEDNLKYNLLDKESGKIVKMTLPEIIVYINSDRSENWTNYDETDWQEGLANFTDYELISKK